MPTREAGEVFGPRMTLFADVLSVGLATAVVCLPLITVPAALSTLIPAHWPPRESLPRLGDSCPMHPKVRLAAAAGP